MIAVLVAALLGHASAFADGPGTRILTTPSGPQRASPATERDLQRCETLRAEDKERCMRAARAAAAADEKTRGPEATGAASGASSAPSTGASSGAAAGGTAPR
ncbi:MAG TPA: hypothetical protein VFB93_03900 [Burkholderiales bacterium]|nr:hypothetical protein [Burkholderiales bacterium]